MWVRTTRVMGIRTPRVMGIRTTRIMEVRTTRVMGIRTPRVMGIRTTRIMEVRTTRVMGVRTTRVVGVRMTRELRKSELLEGYEPSSKSILSHGFQKWLSVGKQNSVGKFGLWTLVIMVSFEVKMEWNALVAFCPQSPCFRYIYSRCLCTLQVPLQYLLPVL